MKAPDFFSIFASFFNSLLCKKTYGWDFRERERGIERNTMQWFAGKGVETVLALEGIRDTGISPWKVN